MPALQALTMYIIVKMYKLNKFYYDIQKEWQFNIQSSSKGMHKSDSILSVDCTILNNYFCNCLVH